MCPVHTLQYAWRPQRHDLLNQPNIPHIHNGALHLDLVMRRHVKAVNAYNSAHRNVIAQLSLANREQSHFNAWHPVSLRSEQMDNQESMPLEWNATVRVHNPTSVTVFGGGPGVQYDVSAVHPFIQSRYSPFCLITRSPEALDKGSVVTFSGLVVSLGPSGATMVNTEVLGMAEPLALRALGITVDQVHVVGRGRIHFCQPLHKEPNLRGWWILTVTHNAWVEGSVKFGRFVDFHVKYVDNTGLISGLANRDSPESLTVECKGTLMQYAQDVHQWVVIVSSIITV
ncbi:uncharacterized protein MELLADRAFT_103264 [Melampsora larici-populina 98AG31]|uniref:Uncharacterized protein n=1 Tax=Melampsora larici-populina (strain 98AG31 / pathotype 3-4-7) TaxID=747676 RepID=F4R9U2_MELLP|nr:uncharacterized protein MELLADRAFT_103264 [Melampsora larici-populina 98AG31]EGG10674.1 hypothetical protein MELLADRAFT_103264 [Melampsora larici-populina 98AG31]